MCTCTERCTTFTWNIIGLDIRYKVYSRLFSGGSNHCYFRWKMLFHEIFRKKSFRTATPTELHPDFCIEAIPPLYMYLYNNSAKSSVTMFSSLPRNYWTGCEHWLGCTAQADHIQALISWFIWCLVACRYLRWTLYWHVCKYFSCKTIYQFV